MRHFGLIGYPLSHSFSAQFFKDKFAKEGITDAVYELYPITSLAAFPALVTNHRLSGLNVTIPYKQEVIAYLDEVSPVVAVIGACNCIHIRNGRSMGYNTDVIGFAQSLRPLLKPHHRAALVLGTGGAAKAVIYVLKQMGIEYLSVSSSNKEGSISYESLDKDILQRHTIIINTTPLGMYPHVDKLPPVPYQYIDNSHLLYDLIYNPAETVFLREGKARGATIKNGLEMLIIQAEESWKIWNA